MPDSCLERNNIILTEIPRATRDESRTGKSTRLVGKDVRNFGNNPAMNFEYSPVAVPRFSPDVTNGCHDRDRWRNGVATRLTPSPIRRANVFLTLPGRRFPRFSRLNPAATRLKRRSRAAR